MIDWRSGRTRRQLDEIDLACGLERLACWAGGDGPAR